jgi:hypothetical protein
MGNQCCPDRHFFDNDPAPNFDEIIDEYKRRHSQHSQHHFCDSNIEILSSLPTEGNETNQEKNEKEKNEKNQEKNEKEKNEENPYAEPGEVIQIFPPIRRQHCIRLRE